MRLPVIANLTLMASPVIADIPPPFPRAGDFIELPIHAAQLLLCVLGLGFTGGYVVGGVVIAFFGRKNTTNDFEANGIAITKKASRRPQRTPNERFGMFIAGCIGAAIALAVMSNRGRIVP